MEREGAGDPEEGEGSDRWRRRPLAAAFDLLASEYGWTDHEIADLTLGRIRIAVEVIQERRREEWEVLATLFERHAQAVSSFFSVMVDRKDQSKVQRAAARIRFWRRETKRIPTVDEITRGLGLK